MSCTGSVTRPCNPKGIFGKEQRSWRLERINKEVAVVPYKEKSPKAKRWIAYGRWKRAMRLFEERYPAN